MVHVTVLRAMTPCTVVDVYRRFEPEYKGSASLGGVGIAGPSDHYSVSRPTVGTVEGSFTCYLNATSHFPLRVSGAPSLSFPGSTVTSRPSKVPTVRTVKKQKVFDVTTVVVLTSC